MASSKDERGKLVAECQSNHTGFHCSNVPQPGLEPGTCGTMCVPRIHTADCSLPGPLGHKGRYF